jgi:translation initiation factor 4A
MNTHPTTSNTTSASFTSIVESEPNMSDLSKINWDDFGLKTELLRGIYSYGFENPSDIQKKSIPYLVQGKDIIGQAQSGTGKTGAFTIGSIQQVDVTKETTQVLIILPTHELVLQTCQVIESLTPFIPELRVKKLLGGTSITDDIRELQTTIPHIVVACTGRLVDMIGRRALNTSDIKICVLDEADEMLSAGFKDEIHNIFQLLPPSVQIALFSATMPEPILKLTEKFMRDPVKIIMEPEKLNLDGITQYFVSIYDDREKYDTMKDIYSRMSAAQTIIYANSVPRVIDLYYAMVEDGFSVCCIHSNMTKPERKAVISKFRDCQYRILISSNLTARGVDIQQVNAVLNFDIPKSPELYLHRIGRSGRWGRKGIAINFVTVRDVQSMRTIEEHYRINIKELPSDFSYN